MIPISFEFYPPKTDQQRAQLDRTANKLKTHNPQYVSCTFGAGGSTLHHTAETVAHLKHHHHFCTAPHLSCVGGSRDEISQLLNHYRTLDCKRIVALRGDLPSGMGHPGDLRYAIDLINLIRHQHNDYFHIEVAAYPETHPQANNALVDIKHFANKVKAGANAAITQYFYNPDAYFHFLDSAQKLGVEIPIIPGIMPISNFSQLQHFSEMCGAEIPRWITTKMQAYGDDTASIRAFGADIVTNLCQRLIQGGAPGLHFYTLNLANPTQTVLTQLKV